MREKIKGWLAGVMLGLISLVTLKKISPILGACLIVEQQGKVLVIDRVDGLGYTIPGGIVRYDETVEQAVLREVHEETGYRAAISGLVGVYADKKRDPRFRAIAIAYRGYLVAGALRSSNEGRVCWMAPSEIMGHMAFDCDEMLKDYISGNQRFS
jgi:ADP-ribose pyrophosphatase YjhB (NUDIX family)